jgi:integrase
MKEEAERAGRGSPLVTVADLFDDLMVDYEINDKKSQGQLRARLQRHLLPWFGKIQANKLTTREIQAYTRHRLEEGASNASINRELAALKRAYSLGMRSDAVVKRPYIPLLQEANARKGFFEKEELDRVLAALPSWLHPPLTFAYYTGWRVPSEILPMTWEQVDLEHATVSLYVGQTKNKEARTIYLPAVLLDILTAQKRRQDEDYPGCQWVFDRHGQRIKSFRVRWRNAKAVTGLNRIVHDFRRTAVRNMVRAGIPERVAMSISGHKTRGVFERYNIVSPADLQEAARKMNPETMAEPRQNRILPLPTRLKKVS